jgi:hypothetical protein
MQQAFYTVGSMCKTLLAENAVQKCIFSHVTPPLACLGLGMDLVLKILPSLKDCAILWQAKPLLAKQNP